MREKFWDDLARKGSFTSGFEDHFAEQLEWDTLQEIVSAHLDNPSKRNVMEIGCHVGFTSSRLFERMLPASYQALDVSASSIEAADQYKQTRGFEEIQFFVASAADVPRPEESCDTLFSIRCIQNIQTVEEQLSSFQEIERLLVPGGIAVIIENWQDELDRLNGLRAEAGLSPINSPGHTRFLRRSELMQYIEQSFEVIENKNFMSAYYFGTRFAKWLDSNEDAKNLDSGYNRFFAEINQEDFKIKLGPTLFVLRKRPQGENGK